MDTKMNPAYYARLQRAVELHKRSARLLSSLSVLPSNALSRRDVHFARYYNNLRRDVRNFINDPEVKRLVPGSVWCLEVRYILYGLLTILLLTLAAFIADALSWIWISDLALPMYLVISAVVFIFLGTVAVALVDNPDHFWWWRASSVAKVVENARRLESFLVEYLPERYPELTVQKKESEATANSNGSGNERTAHLKQELAELKSSYSTLSRRIKEIDSDIGVTTESFRKGVLKEQRESLSTERDDVAQEITRIDSELERLRRSR